MQNLSSMILLLIFSISASTLAACSSATETLEPSNTWPGDSDRALTSKPYPCGPQSQDAACLRIPSFGKLDKNGDRFVSVKKELTGAVNTGLKKADANEDHKISVIEYLAYQDRSNKSPIRDRICVSNSGNKNVNWDLIDTRLNAKDEGYIASMGQHAPKANGNGYICTEVLDAAGPYTFRAEVEGQFCLVQLLTGNAMIDVNATKRQLRCTPQRDGFHGTPVVSKEFPVDYARSPSKTPASGYPFRELTLRNNSAASTFEVSLKNPQGRSFLLTLKPRSAYRFDLNTRLDEFYKPIQVEVRNQTSEFKTSFPMEQNLNCQQESNPQWSHQQQQNCKSVLVGTYGFVSDLTVW